ncbi:SDR family NAD(P)-dependent oxidoreductase [Eubacteriales bacterium DFI.9.88]|nr:SDR family NAD(P)-dependent oxidoreductase [Eubacteriales bacterium DFI.9.88]
MKTNKSILISGCGGKVGGAAARLFRQRGWNVIGLDLTGDCPSADRSYPCDIRDSKAVLEVIRLIEGEQPLAAVFHSAGVTLETGFEETDMKGWQRVMKTIFGGAANLCRAEAPYMVKRKSGKIILLAPDYRWEERECIMEASAAGMLHGFAKCFGAEVAEDNVLVNALAPNVPIDLAALTETVFYLADQDTYTAGQVISIGGAKKQEVTSDEV